jgi:Concanavalin A-like lectin/glucanases superfamily
MEAGAGITRRILAFLLLADLFCASAGANLVSYWKLDETAGIIAYDSAGSNNGTLQNGPVWTMGKFGGALSFDGVNDYVDVPDNASLRFKQTDSFSICCWAKPAGGTSIQSIFSKYRTGGTHNVFGYLLYWSADTSTFRFGAEKSYVGTTYVETLAGSTPVGNWYFVVGVYSNKSMKIYLNGQLASNGTFAYDTGTTVPTHDATIGARCYDSSVDMYFTGEIDDVRIYNNALTAEEVQQLYQNTMMGASNPRPSDGATDVATNVVLSWATGPNTVSHNIYLGTAFSDVNAANTASPQYMGNQSVEVNNFDPPGCLNNGVTYYWRIDEVGNDGNTVKGGVWSFTTNSFIGWWKLNETDGNTAYDSAGGHNGTLVNGPVWTTGEIDGALSFDGVDDYVEIPDANLNLTSQVTISAWINSKSRTARQAIVGQWNSADSPAKQSVLLDARGDVDQRFCLSLSGNGTDATKYTVYSKQRFLPGTWYHVVGTYDGSMMKIYVNGQIENSTPAAGNIFVSNTEWIIGAINSGTDAFFAGIIDDVRIYNRTLSADEVTQLFREGEVRQSFSDPYRDADSGCWDLIDPAYWQFNVPNMIHIGTPNDVETVRTNIINYLWPTTGWPGSKMPQSVTTVYDPCHGINNSGWYQGLSNLNLVAKIDRLDIKMDHDKYGVDWHSYAYLLQPKTSINRLLIVHQGHGDSFFLCGINETIEFFLSHGFSIMTFYMPLYGENVPYSQDWPYNTYGYCHDGVYDVLGKSFIHVFLEPVVVGINYVKSQYNFLDISMTGISGGGWTTHWCAALDTRISMSFPVAGSLPLYIMQVSTITNGNSWGCHWENGIDKEQYWSELYGYGYIDGSNSITSYLDLYIMGGYGENREEVQILNQYECIFYGVTYRTYEPYVRDAVEQLGQGAFSVYLNTIYDEDYDHSWYNHAIHRNAINNVMYPTMQRNFVGRQADFSGDGSVDIDDLVIFADAWLSQAGAANWNENCDLSGDGQITLLDFAEFAKYWLWQAN